MAYLHAELDRYQRQDMMDDFNYNDDIDIIITTYVIAGVGVDLHLKSHHLALFEPAVNTSLEEQAIGRVFRTLQEYDTMIYRIITRGTYQVVQLSKALDKYVPIIDAMRRKFGPLWMTAGDRLVKIFQNDRDMMTEDWEKSRRYYDNVFYLSQKETIKF